MILKKVIPNELFFLCISYFVFSILDYATTSIALPMGGKELNPIMATDLWIVIKFTVVIGVILWVVLKNKYKLIAFASSLMAVIVVSNIFKIIELGG